MSDFPAEAREHEVAWLRARGLRVPAGFIADPWIAPTRPFAARGTPVDSAALAADLPLLRETLRAAYAGWEAAATADWDRLFDDWARHLARGVGDPFEPWARWQHAHPDRHSGPWPGSPTPIPFTGLIDGGETEAWRDAEGVERQRSPALRVHAARGPDGRPLAVVRALGELHAPVAVRDANGWHEVRALPQESVAELPATPQLHPLARDVGWLRIPTPAADHTAPPLPPPAWRTVVCDLRGNRGGSLGPWPDFLTRWLGPETFTPWTAAGGWEIDSPRTPALRWGAAQARLGATDGPLAPEARTAIQTVLDGLGRGPETRTRRVRPGKWRWHDRRASGALPRLVVLVDDRCGSDGELLAWLLAARPGAILAGRGTAGACGWVRPGLLWLPHAGTGFQIATARLDPLGPDVAVDGLGLPVDVLLDSTPGDEPGLLALARSLCP